MDASWDHLIRPPHATAAAGTTPLELELELELIKLLLIDFFSQVLASRVIILSLINKLKRVVVPNKKALWLSLLSCC